MSEINLKNKTILITGAAGFIGSNLVKRIYQENSSATIIGIDNMNACGVKWVSVFPENPHKFSSQNVSGVIILSELEQGLYAYKNTSVLMYVQLR